MMASLLLLAALSQSPAQPAPNAQGDALSPVDAGAPRRPGPDVDKMPFTPFSISEVVQFHLPDIQQCYDGVVMEIGKNPPEGTVMAKFTILPNGLTEKVGVDARKSTIKDARIRDCVTDAIRDWVFPKPEDARPHPIVYPFALHVQKEK